MDIPWSDERMGRLETLYRSGLSFSLIAADIGVSRSAVIGKAHRMNLPKRKEPLVAKPYSRPRASPSPRRRERAMPTRKMPPPPTLPEPEPPPIEDSIPAGDYSCTIDELKDNCCRWPLWGLNTRHEQRRYCGRPTAMVSLGIPYCLDHTRVAETGQTPRNER